MNLTRLRNLLHPFIVNPELGTHALLPSICDDFALPAPPPPDRSKRDRMSASFANLADANLAKTAERVLAMCHPPAQTRQEIEDIQLLIQKEQKKLYIVGCVPACRQVHHRSAYFSPYIMEFFRLTCSRFLCYCQRYGYIGMQKQSGNGGEMPCFDSEWTS